MARILGSTGTRRRRRLQLGAIVSLVALLAVFAVPNALAVLSGSPSLFESGDDPTVGLGNMIVDNTVPPDTDWVSVTGNAKYAHVTDAAHTGTDDSFVPGQKQDTTCPDVTGHQNPPKDDFTDVASFSEVASNGDTFLYGATIRYAANGTASENIELKSGLNGLCPGQPTGGLLARTAGDKLLAIDYLGGGSAVQFHVLTWIETQTEACNVANDVAPCWGSTVQTLSTNGAEGGVNGSAIAAGASTNPINGTALTAGQFAEFGVNLRIAGIIPAGTCKSFPQSVWESRASGSSFVSTTKDISIENKTISNCGEIVIIKRTNPRGANQDFAFTSDITTATAGSELTCTADTTPAAFTLNDNGNTTSDSAGNTEDCTKVKAGTYTVTEGADPSGFAFDNFSCTASTGSSATPASSTSQKNVTITLAADGLVTCVYTNQPLKGALRILKESTKTGNPIVKTAGAEFCYSTSTGCSTTNVTDNGTGDDSTTVGEVCVSGLAPGTYYVNETKAPTGYGGASQTNQAAVVVADTNCTTNKPSNANSAVFTNPPLSDIQVNFRDGGSGETTGVIACDNTTGTTSTTPATGWTTTKTVTGVNAPTIVTCTITIDP
jgi:hypothetical protein